MDLHASGDFHSGDSIDISKIPIHDTPKSTSNTKRRSGEDPTVIPFQGPHTILFYRNLSADFAAGDFDESLIVDEMKKLCHEDNDFDGEERDESGTVFPPVPSTVSLPFPVKTDSSESSVDDYKKKIASVRTRRLPYPPTVP